VTDPCEVLRADPVMSDLVDEHGPVTVAPAADPFRRLVVSILNQQLSTASAAAIRERVFDLLGSVTSEAVLAADPDALRDAGCSDAKVRYLQSAAEAFRERDLSPAALADRSDESVVDELTTIDGVGEWTAEMYLIFGLGRPDVLPLGDLAVRRGIADLYGCDSRAEMRAVAQEWRPYRSYGTKYVWAHYESP
jgi:DNA-3-methyladenine glycosylase II